MNESRIAMRWWAEVELNRIRLAKVPTNQPPTRQPPAASRDGSHEAVRPWEVKHSEAVEAESGLCELPVACVALRTRAGLHTTTS